MLNQKIRHIWDWLMRPVGRSLARLGVGADAITALGVLLQGFAAYLIIDGALFAAGVVATLAAISDTLDGAVAKAVGSNSRFGALLDSTADRFSDALFFVPVAWLYGVSPDVARHDQPGVAALALVALVASFLVSYVKARAEGLGYRCNVGIVERAERLILVILALVLADFVPAFLPIVLGALAGLSIVTVVQRLVHVHRQAAQGASTRPTDRPGPPAPPPRRAPRARHRASRARR